MEERCQYKPEKPKFVFTIPAFQNGGSPSTERSLAGGGLMCKLDLRDAYFTIPINQKYRKYLRFKLEGTLY